MTALSILQRPPCANAFFDNYGPENGNEQSIFLAKYKTKTVSVYDVIDGGERIEPPMIPPKFDDQARLLPKWTDERIPKPKVYPEQIEIGFGQEIQIKENPNFSDFMDKTQN